MRGFFYGYFSEYSKPTFLFAIVDVETTGGHASGHAMTEIAIVLHDGTKVVDNYSQLLNPKQHIPLNIQTLTGITPDMVEDAPTFPEVADEVREFLGDHIFVAHNVNFDYSFVKSAFASVGIDYNPKRMCSVRYARRVEKGLKSYSLGNLCKHFKVNNEAAHRAWGDATATAKIMEYLLEKDKDGQWQFLIKKNSGEFNLPANLPSDDYHNLPEVPGVYYFMDNLGKPLYIGKAKNLKKRVATHFVSDKEGSKSQGFKREIFNIKFEKTGSELLASLLEDHEIRHYWPKYNRAQKNPKRKFAVYLFYNQKNVPSLAINKITSQQGYLRDFHSNSQAQSWVLKQIEEYNLNAAKCGFPFSFLDREITEEQHMTGVQRLIDDLNSQSQNLVIKTYGREPDEDGFALVKDGHLAGMGFVPHDVQISSYGELQAFTCELRSSITTQAIIRKVLEEGRYAVEEW